MIQEILDYLLIKAQFILMSSDELLENMKEETNFEIYCDIICNVIEHENFFNSSPELIAKLTDIIHQKKFDGVHKKETIVDLNKMLEIVNRYKTMTDYEKYLCSITWLKQQTEIRKLPYRKLDYYNLENIYQFIFNEKYYAQLILNQQSGEIFNPFYALSTINMLINDFPQVFKDGDCFSYAYSLSLLLQEKIYKSKYRIYSKMAKNTMHSLEQLEQELQPAVTKKYQFNIEKR